MSNNNLKNKPEKLNNFLESTSVEELDDAACVAVAGCGFITPDFQPYKFSPYDTDEAVYICLDEKKKGLG
ncbi:MAG: hypothetical protein DSM106950_39375 [Stigonema ocellatum SAG 48.90 = DSM 106950]|nr:hypothetical protein [Stigonema ocellatum SAG 48.90 = DSM 106950]